jgi:hypothetical protein
MNELESILKCYNERGLSIRQIKLATGFSKRKIKHLVYTSNFIEDTNPYLHGSSKSRINVYNYTPVAMLYSKRRVKNNKFVENFNENTNNF